jgi:NAD(P)-dependent dehydrogenase (short-subunit alcohol dehydrogenase family)
MELDGATVVLTGATTGIGRATALAVAPRAGRLIIHGPQSPDEIAGLMDQLRAVGEVVYLQADYGELAAVDRLAEGIRSATERIDVLINNAARPGAPTRTLSRDGIELTLQTNYLAPVALTTALLDLMPTGRIVNVASATHLSATLYLEDLGLERHTYAPSTAYAHSKLALVTYTCWLAKNLPSASIEAVSMHPGVIATDLLHAMFSITGDTVDHAAANLLEVVALTGDNGTYYDERSPAAPNPTAQDPEPKPASTKSPLAYCTSTEQPKAGGQRPS